VPSANANLKSHVLVGVLGPIGVVFSLLVGITLMTLLFYSSRHGYDEQVSEIFDRDDDSATK
jgi:hypothetical protein